MFVFWLLFITMITCLVAGILMMVLSWKKGREDSYSSRRFTNAGGWVWMGGIIVLIAGLIMGGVLSLTAIGRTLDEDKCEKRASFADSNYVWMDYNFFDYECVLMTPSGNITGTPVLPIEDVTER